MPDQQVFDIVRFVDNPEPRVPCVLVLDTSGSMIGQPIDELNAGLAVCRRDLMADPLAAKRVEPAVVTFGGPVKVACPFETVDRFDPPRLVADGDTRLGEGLHSAIDLVTERKALYKTNGIAYYRPWIFLITDGAPSYSWDDAALRLQDAERQNAFVFYSVGVEGADFGVLRRLSKRTEPLKLKGLSFRSLFQWLSGSLSRVSQSQISDAIVLTDPTSGPKGWGVVPAAQ